MTFVAGFDVILISTVPVVAELPGVNTPFATVPRLVGVNVYVRSPYAGCATSPFFIKYLTGIVTAVPVFVETTPPGINRLSTESATSPHGT